LSFRVLVIPEDPTNNGYILKPLMEAVLADAGKPRARVSVLTSPRVRGFDDAVRAIREKLPAAYGHMDAWVFVPDADRATRAAMESLERDLAARGVRLICSPAVPEVEIYCCAGCPDELGMAWSTAREHPRFKESVFEPLMRRIGDSRRAGGGRDVLVRASLARRGGLYRLCPELADLRERLAALTEPQG
jgi:hypothetical protein